MGAGPVGLAGFLIFGMRYYYVALTDRRLIFLNASFWTSRPKGFAWADPRDSITISDLQTDNKLWNWGKISSPTKQNLRMNFHAFWRPELKAMGDMLADRIVGPRLGFGAAGDPVPDAIRAAAVRVSARASARSAGAAISSASTRLRRLTDGPGGHRARKID